jgi:hypothetical protein
MDRFLVVFRSTDPDGGNQTARLPIRENKQSVEAER